MNTPGMFSLGVFNWGTDDTIAFRHTIGDMDLMPLEETSLKGWIFSGSKDGILCYSEGIDTVWDVNARNIAPAFLINTGYSVEEEKEMRSSKTGNEAVDGKYSVFSFFETPRHYFVKCFEGSNQSKFYLYGLDKATGELKRETSPLNAQELFKNNWTLAGIRKTTVFLSGLTCLIPAKNKWYSLIQPWKSNISKRNILISRSIWSCNR